ncbi:MAG: O-antigen ligase family protein [Microcella sp.]|uniref:O-antigen ligase family protein n=1 Tax=Microcella sp. TaxID=1913979 RepID=UPI0024CD4BF9|nr:O-antigen ligase family protein [Microcella sp.]UYN82557.1 MAG: O-antigen ligase family protein [Microcella sp.]
MSWLRDPRVALAALTLFTLLAGDAWRNLISWYGWGALVVLLLIGWVVVAVRHRIDLRRVPIALATFVAIVTLSIGWSAYPLSTALGVAATVATVFVAIVMAHTVELSQLVRALGVALRWILGLSLVFEFVVAAFIGRPVLPLWVEYDGEVPRAFYWSRALLFEGGRIQGIPGNANLLAFAALLGVIVFGIQLADRRIGRAAGWGWITVSVLTLVLTASATVVLCAVGAALAWALIMLARRMRPTRRWILYVGTTITTTALLTAAWLLRYDLLELLGRSDDLTGRLGIWDAVEGLIRERPVFGWGWVGYWPPWEEPFTDLAIIDDVTYLQAHNAWLDVMLQVGLVGVVVFAILVVTTGLRALSWSVDAPLGDFAPTPALRLFSGLLFVVLLVHSLAESRLLIEAGLLLLCFLAVTTRLRGVTVSTLTSPREAASAESR